MKKTSQNRGADSVERLVSPLAMRPASDKKQCFYCQQPIGAEHKDDCVLLRKKVKVRMTVEYEVSVPAHWQKSDVEFHRNDGSWCADNALDELKKLSESEGCLCHAASFEYLGDASGPYLDEG